MMRAVVASVAALIAVLILQTIQSPVTSGSQLGQSILQFPTLTRTPTPTATRTPTSAATATSTSCGAAPAVLLSPTRVFPGDSLNARGVGFMPNSTVRARLFSSDGSEVVAPVVAPVGSNCEVVVGITTRSADTPGRYRVAMEGMDRFERSVAPSADFDILDRAGTTPPTQERTATPTPSQTATATPAGPEQQRPAPIELSQSLQPMRTDAVPVQGQPFGWRHVVRIRNTSSAEVVIFAARLGVSFSEYPGLGLLTQGEQVGTSFSTDYADDVRFTSTSATQGQVSQRGTSLVWEGQIGPGQSVEVTAAFDQTPSQALVFSNPIRGQSLVVADPRGVNLLVPAPSPPLPPPAQRLVQPPPPPIDPAAGPRFFPATGFTVVDDALWVYYHRRGGPRTFGPPISRLMLINGARVQLFERGMLEVREGGAVMALNLLEPPFLPYQNLGDVLLPAGDDALVVNAPQPDQPDFGERAQEFVRLNSPQDFGGLSTQFYSTFLSTVRFHDAFVDGRGDPNLVPGFNLEIWGLPRSQPSIFATTPEQSDPSRALLLYQRGIMVHDSRTGTTAALPLGYYLRAILVGDDALPALAEAAAQGPLWGQYDPDSAGGLARPDELPGTELVLAFTREDDLGEAVTAKPRRRWIQVLDPTPTYTDAGEPLWTAAPGEWYRVVRREEAWALAVWELDPPENAVWIIVDERVRLSLE